jgi:phage baseplate assembly protein W
MSFDLKIENNDLNLNPDGTLQTVHDNNKLAQDIVKAILTPLGSNKFFRWYGSLISARIIGNVLSASQTEAEIERAVQNTLSNLVALQKVQSRTQYVSAGETIAAIRSVSASRDPEDPRQWEIKVSVLTRKLTLVEETFSLRVV